MKSPSPTSPTDLACDSTHARDLFDSVSFALRSKQLHLDSLNNELAALQQQQIIDERSRLTQLKTCLQSYGDALYRVARHQEQHNTAILEHVKNRTRANLLKCHQKADGLTVVVQDWSLSLAQGKEHLILAEKNLAEESSKMQLLLQLLTDSRQLYADKLVARGQEVKTLIDDQRLDVRLNDIQRADMELRQKQLTKWKKRLEDRKLRLKDTAQERAQCE